MWVGEALDAPQGTEKWSKDRYSCIKKTTCSTSSMVPDRWCAGMASASSRSWGSGAAARYCCLVNLICLIFGVYGTSGLTTSAVLVTAFGCR